MFYFMYRMKNDLKYKQHEPFFHKLALIPVREEGLTCTVDFTHRHPSYLYPAGQDLSPALRLIAVA